MCVRKKMLIVSSFLVLLFTFAAVPTTNAKKNDYAAVVNHLKTKYQAKKVKIPLMWLARFAVKVVRPAGVKSFSVTMFEDLRFSRETLDEEMQAAMRKSLDADWSPIFRVRSRAGEQVYMYMRESGSDIKIMLVTIEQNQAAVVRATFSPDKLAEFIENPKVFGISLNDKGQTESEKSLKPIEKVSNTPQQKVKSQ